MSTAYHPQTDGLTERMNRTMEQVLRNFVHDSADDWEDFLPSVQFAINNPTQAESLLRHWPGTATLVAGHRRQLGPPPIASSTPPAGNRVGNVNCQLACSTICDH
jgi:hypothetical protein